MLTELAIRKLAPKGAERVELWDDKLPGFGIRVSPAGTKSFILMYYVDGRKRRLTLGRYPMLSLIEARQKAMEALTGLQQGRDPQGQAAGAAGSFRFDDVVKDFVEVHCKHHNRPATAHETERILRKRFVSAWGRRDIRGIAKSDVLRVLDTVAAAGAPSAANHDLAAVRKLFRWCVARGLIEQSPCSDLARPAAVASRERVLADEEIAAVWATAHSMGYPFGVFVQLLILTAQRRGEVIGMQWSELDLTAKTWTMAGPRTKNKTAHVVPLSPTALALIAAIPRVNDTLVFPARGNATATLSGFSKLKRQLDDRSGVTEWTLHDLRRTAATGMARLGVTPHVVERVLNHTSGTVSGVAAVYNRFSYLPEMRVALEKWSDAVIGAGRQHERVSRFVAAGHGEA